MRSIGIGILCSAATLSLFLGQATAQEKSPAKGATAAPAAQALPPGLQAGPATVATHWSKNKYPTSIPEGATYYVVVKGDTLWDIAKRFLGSPFLWPQIWNENKYVTDAHWIYPGDPVIIPRVAVVAGQAGGPAGLGPEEGEEGGPKEGRVSVPPGAVLFPVTEEATMLCSHHIVQDQEDDSLKIIGSEQGASKNAFADRDILYLNKGSNAGVKAGDMFLIRHTAYKVKHPETGKSLGTKIETLGWLRVILVQETSATGIVEGTCNDIHVGDYLAPYEKPSVPLVLRRPPPDRLTPPSGKAHGYVVDIAEDAGMAGAGHLLSVDIGTQAGIAPGSILVVYRVMYPSVPTPRNVLGEVAVVTVREKTATAKVLSSTDTILPGDEVELR